MTKSKAAQPMAKGKPRSQGLESNKLVRPGQRYGNAKASIVNPGGADQLGQHLKNATPLFGGSFKQEDLGNYRAGTTECKVGGSRDIYPSGYQSLHGTPVKAEVDRRPDPPATRNPNHSFPDDRPKRRA